MDWNAYRKAVDLLSSGNPRQALAHLQELERSTSAPVDRVVLMLGRANCLADLSDASAALSIVAEARLLVGGVGLEGRLLTSQLALAEVGFRLLAGQYGTADEQCCRIKEEYKDLLSDPSNQDFAATLMARHAVTLVHLQRHREATQLFRILFSSPEVDDRQRMLLYFGVALLGAGQHKEARDELLKAASGADSDLREKALEHLRSIERTQ